MPTFGKSCRRPWLHGLKKTKLSLILKQIFQDGGRRTCMRTLGGKHTRKSARFWQRKNVQYFLIKFAKYLMLKACWLWFVIFKKYVELTRPKIESRDPIFFTGARARSRVSGNDRLFSRGSEFGPNSEIPASTVIQPRPRPGWGAITPCCQTQRWLLKDVYHDVFGISYIIPCSWYFHCLWNSYYHYVILHLWNSFSLPFDMIFKVSCQ